LAGGIENAAIDAADVVVSSHACGTLTDRVLDRATAIDALRAKWLEALDYRIRAQAIPAAIADHAEHGATAL
jgi:hypothetical protein